MDDVASIRNVALVGQDATGRSSLATALLLHLGAVIVTDDGQLQWRTEDVDPRLARGAVGLASVDWRGYRLNLIDTPSRPDFHGVTLSAMRVADLVVFVIDSVAGVQPHDLLLWRQADRWGQRRLVFVNQLDGERSDPDRTLADLHRRFGEGVGRFPLIHGAAGHGAGMAELVEAMTRLGPAPGESGGIELCHDGGTPSCVDPDPGGETLLYVFMTHTDPRRSVSWFRVLSGQVRSGDSVVNTRTGESALLTRVAGAWNWAPSPVERLVAGDIGSAVDRSGTAVGDCLAAGPRSIQAVPVPYPPAIHAVAVRPASAEVGWPAMVDVLRQVVREDPSLDVRPVAETGQTVLAGLGAMHIDAAVARSGQLGFEIETGAVAVAYRERLAGPCTVTGRSERAIDEGGSGATAVSVRLSPRPDGDPDDLEVGVEGVGRTAEPALGAALAAAFEEAMARRSPSRFPLTALRAEVTGIEPAADGGPGPDGGDPAGHRQLASAVADALERARSTVGTELLEPVSEVVVWVPADRLGAVVRDLGSRRGRVLGHEPGGEPGEMRVRALVPTSELGALADRLASSTSGWGRLAPSHHGYRVAAGDARRPPR